MSWTDERVETLKRMWAEGQSASQIAKELGGVTRNAVIGKVHRLGLSNRVAGGKDDEEDTPVAAASAAVVGGVGTAERGGVRRHPQAVARRGARARARREPLGDGHVAGQRCVAGLRGRHCLGFWFGLAPSLTLGY